MLVPGLLARLQSSARFRAAAASFPLTRPIARRRARAVFDLCAGFVYSQTLLAIVRLDIPQILLGSPHSAASLAQRLGLPEQRIERLLLAGVSLRLLVRDRGGRFALGPLGSALIDNPGVTAMIAHHALLYDDLRDPVSLLRDGDGSLGRFWDYGADTTSDRSAPYTALMAASQPMIAAEILAAYRLGHHRHLLDVGGGSGNFVRAALARAPRLRATLLDLPPVAAVARAAFADAGLSGRADAIGADFHRDPLPTGADLVSLVRVLHDHDDNEALALLKRIRTALSPGARLLLAEPMSETPGAAPIGDAYFGVYLLAMGRGRPRTPNRIAGLLLDAGFRRSRLLHNSMPMLARVIVATA